MFYVALYDMFWYSIFMFVTAHNVLYFIFIFIL